MIIQIGPDGGVTRWLEELGQEVVIVDEVAKDIEKVMKPDLVVFTGGADVSPFLYNHVNEASASNAKRDAKEVLWYHKFYNVPKLGICRGAQFLNVMNGGTMKQDVQGHAIAGTHKARDNDNGFIWDVTSTHHQMMLPSKAANILASKDESCGAGRNAFDSEVLLYQHSQSLCFQPHPEFERSIGKDTYTQYGTNHLLHVCLKRSRFPQITRELMFEVDVRQEEIRHAQARVHALNIGLDNLVWRERQPVQLNQDVQEGLAALDMILNRDRVVPLAGANGEIMHQEMREEVDL